MYDDDERFAEGAIDLDSALVMRNVPVEWHGIGSIADTEAPSSA